jgi:hypothetical protein
MHSASWVHGRNCADAEPWRSIIEGLLQDPLAASTTVSEDVIPAEPVAAESPRLPVFLPGDGMITIYATGERVTPAERARREREAQIAAASNPVTQALAIEAARTRARKLAERTG